MEKYKTFEEGRRALVKVTEGFRTDDDKIVVRNYLPDDPNTPNWLKNYRNWRKDYRAFKEMSRKSTTIVKGDYLSLQEQM